MTFEYDPNKSNSNLVKHAIDFEQAKALWNDSNIISLEAKFTDEPRTLFIGKIDENYWSAITTKRGERIRIISVRKARIKEIELYES
jgi:uncharacterized DUF497 family protein